MPALAGIILAYPAIMTALALVREEPVLGRLYWFLRAPAPVVALRIGE